MTPRFSEYSDIPDTDGAARANKEGAEFDSVALGIVHQIEIIPNDWHPTRRTAHAQCLIIEALRNVAQREQVPVARPVAFRVPRVVDDKISKTEFRLFDDEDEARQAACDIAADYDGLYLVADRRAAFFAQPRPADLAQPALTQEELADFICEVEDRLGPGCDELSVAQAILRKFNITWIPASSVTSTERNTP